MSSTLGLDFEAQGIHDKFVVRLMESQPIHMSVEDTGAKAFVDHVTSSRAVTTSEPCSFVKKLVSKLCVGHDQLILAQTFSNLSPFLLHSSMWTNDQVPREKSEPT